MAENKPTEAVALSFLILLALVAAQNANRGTLGPWLAGKFFNRGEAAPTSAAADPAPIVRGVSAPGVNQPFENGRLPASALALIGQGSHRLIPAAALAYARMRLAANQAGVQLSVTDSYRTLASQISLKARKPTLAATPGTSVHGWGRAIDVRGGGGRREWVQANGAAYGFHWPSWARPGGSKPEPWHFEYAA